MRWLLIIAPCITWQIIHFLNCNLPNVWVAKATIALCNRSGLSAWINSSWGRGKKNVTIIKDNKNLYQSVPEHLCLNKFVHERKYVLSNLPVCILKTISLQAMLEMLTCWKGDIFFRMVKGISCSLCELCEKDSQRSESLRHKDW